MKKGSAEKEMGTNPVLKIISNLGDSVSKIAPKFKKGLLNVGEVAFFIATVFRETWSRNFEFREFAYQCYKIGYKSLALISITGAIMGLVLTIQSRPVLVDFGAVSMLPGMVAVSLIREMGPVITALI